MWTMIIADDEPIIIRGLQRIVDWDKMGINIVGCCKNGNSALLEIVHKKPDIAILDISMPGKTGLEILKEMNYMHITTKVIFISAFQEFGYAVEALRLGAINYLLKPINKNDLIENVKSCLNIGSESKIDTTNGKSETIIDYEHLIQPETSIYICSLVHFFINTALSKIEKQLIEFSIYHFLDRYIIENELGILFYKNNKLCIIFKKYSLIDVIEISKKLIFDTEQQTKNKIGLAIANEVQEMSDIPISYANALKTIDFFYFSSMIISSVVVFSNKIFKDEYTYEDLKYSRRKIMEYFIEMNLYSIKKEFEIYKKIVAYISDGDKETAGFNLLTIVQSLENRMDNIGLSTIKIDSNIRIIRILECTNYDLMCEVAYEFLLDFLKIFKSVFISSDKKDIIKAKTYIEDHYMENLTLEVLSKHIFMNTSYFSSFFKKQTGQNFKEYLNKLRLKHAMELLLSTDQKSYEIASSVGFSDSKYFSEIFLKTYGNTPAAFRKELKNRPT